MYPKRKNNNYTSKKVDGYIIVLFFYSRDKAKEAIIYSYNKHINGFAALLEDEEAADIASEHFSILTPRENRFSDINHYNKNYFQQQLSLAAILTNVDKPRVIPLKTKTL